MKKLKKKFSVVLILSFLLIVFPINLGVALALSAPTITSPANGATVDKDSISVEWTTVPDAVDYEISAGNSTGTFLSDGTLSDGTIKGVSTGNKTSYTIQSSYVSVTGNYWVCVVALDCSSNRKAGYSQFKVVDNSVTIPSAPATVNATAVSSSQITVSWSSVTGATSYKILRATNSAGPYSEITSKTSTSYTNSGLSPSTKYYYKVKAVNSAGESAESDFASATTNAETITIPAAPSGFKATAASSSQINLSWSAVSGANTYNVYMANMGIGGGYTKITTTAGTSFSHTGLTANTLYTYKLTAVNSSGEGEGSFAYAYTQEAPVVPSVPAAPGGIFTTAVSSSQINVSWNAVSGADSYEIYRSGSYYGTYSLIGTTSTTSYSNTGLSASTTYCYKVKSVNSAGASGFSPVQFTTTNVSAILPAPQNVVATPVNDNQINISWNAVAGATSYKILRATSSSGPYIEITSITGYSYPNIGLTAGITYYYKVKAVNSTGESAESAAASATTSGGQIGNPQIKVNIDGKDLIVDNPPRISNGITMVPFRAIFEALGAEVDYQTTPVFKVWGIKGETKIELTAGKTTALINGVEVDMGCSLETRNGRTFVPLRFVANAFGCAVEWNEKEKTVYIVTAVSGNLGNNANGNIIDWQVRYNSVSKEIEAEITPVQGYKGTGKFYLTVYEQFTPLYGGKGGNATYDEYTDIPLYEGDVSRYQGKYFRSWFAFPVGNDIEGYSLFLEHGKTYRIGVREQGYENVLAGKLIEITLPAKPVETNSIQQRFEKAMKLTVGYEGGYSNNKNDYGGETMYGITVATYNRFRDVNHLPRQNVRNISDFEVTDILYNWYWYPVNCDNLNEPLDIVMFDTSVQWSVSGAICRLQEAMGVKVTGRASDIDWNSITNYKDMALKVIEARIVFRYRIVQKDPSQNVFLQGWLNRDNNLKKYIQDKYPDNNISIPVVNPTLEKTQNTVTVLLDGTQLKFDVQPMVVNGRTMVPVRNIFEALGATVNWDNVSQTVTANKEDIEIKLQINSQIAYKNGTKIILDVPARLQNGRVLVPLRFVSESLDAKVEWDEATSTVKITSTPVSVEDYYKAQTLGFNDWNVWYDSSTDLLKARINPPFGEKGSNRMPKFTLIISQVIDGKEIVKYDGDDYTLVKWDFPNKPLEDQQKYYGEWKISGSDSLELEYGAIYRCKLKVTDQNDGIWVSLEYREVSIPDNTKTLAKSILNSNRITLATVHVSGKVDYANVRQNIVDTSLGKPAVRSAYENAPGGTVQLSNSMLKAIDQASNTYSFRISELAGGSHSVGSKHYSGIAVDIDIINGKLVNNNNPHIKDFIDLLYKLGASYVLFEANTHIHAQW